MNERRKMVQAHTSEETPMSTLQMCGACSFSFFVFRAYQGHKHPYRRLLYGTIEVLRDDQVFLCNLHPCHMGSLNYVFPLKNMSGFRVR